MKIGGRVSNMCLSSFIVEIRGKTPQEQQGPLRRTLLFWGQKYCLGISAPTKGVDGVYVYRWGVDAIHR